MSYFIKDIRELKERILNDVIRGYKIDDIRIKYHQSIIYHGGGSYGRRFVDEVIVNFAKSKNLFSGITMFGKQEPYHQNEMYYGKTDLSHITYESLSESEREFYNQVNK